MKYAIIRKVPFKVPGKKPQIRWAHVLVESEGLALVLVPKAETTQPHSIFIAQENVAMRFFVAVGAFRFDLETEHLMETGDKLRMLAKSLMHAEFLRKRRPDDDFS